jgi:hypothetical protein
VLRAMARDVTAAVGRHVLSWGKAATFGLASVVAGSCASHPVQIKNLKQGLMRPTENRGWEVYQEGSRFDVLENGQCVVDGKRTSCMWFGIDFDYTAAAAKTTLMCTWRSNVPIISVTPAKVVGRVTEENVDLVLEGRSGHEVRPGYIEVPWDGHDSRLKYECYYQGAVVLSVEFELAGSA